MTKVKVKKDYTVTHNGVSYSENTEIELLKTEAERLVDAGAVELIEEEDTDLETTETDVVSTEEKTTPKGKKKGSK
ncbi:MAG: hypothetical protein CR959_01340 [Fusobacteriales bacterium]|nr:MAG: hypothetical protein CR959_01340 [Fusobacteriales bacterium]